MECLFLVIRPKPTQFPSRKKVHETAERKGVKQDKHACQKRTAPYLWQKKGAAKQVSFYGYLLLKQNRRKKRMRGEVLNATVCEFDNKLTRLDKQVIKSSNTTTTNGILKNRAISAGPGRQDLAKATSVPPTNDISTVSCSGSTDWRRNTLKKQKTNINWNNAKV